MALIPIVTTLASIVPSIVGLFGGDKTEDAASAVADIAKKVTGVNDAQSAIDGIMKDPLLQIEFAKQYDNNRASLEKAYLFDRQHARESHKHSIMPAVIVSVLTVGLLAFIAALMFVDIPEANIRMIDTIFGSYLTAWLGSLGYWNGTTRGSADKTNRIK